MTDLLAPPTAADLRSRSLIRAAVLHLANDQPMLVDLFGLPSPADAVLVCTNVRSLTGKRPIWADHTESIYYFPWLHVRFLEVPPAAHEMAGAFPALPAPEGDAPPTLDLDLDPDPDLDPDLEIDEDFLRRVRDF